MTLGFNHVRDRALVAPLIDDYFDKLRRVYDSKTNEMATNLIEGRDGVRRALEAQARDREA